MTKYNWINPKDDVEYLISSNILDILTYAQKKSLGIIKKTIPIENVPKLIEFKERYIIRYPNGGRTLKLNDAEGNNLYRKPLFK